MKSTTLKTLQLSRVKGVLSVKLHLTHVYTPPEVDPVTAQRMINDLKSQLFSNKAAAPRTSQTDKPSASVPAAHSTSVPARADAKRTTTDTTSGVATKMSRQDRCIRVIIPGRPVPKNNDAQECKAKLKIAEASPAGNSARRRNSGCGATKATSEVGSRTRATTGQDDGGQDDSGTLSELSALVRGESRSSSKRFNDFKTTKVRFRLPARVQLEALFRVDETAADLGAFLKSCLRSPSGATGDFTLFVTPPRQVLSTKKIEDKTLAQLGLVPSAIVHVSCPAMLKPPPSELQSSAGTTTPVSSPTTPAGWFLKQDSLH